MAGSEQGFLRPELWSRNSTVPAESAATGIGLLSVHVALMKLSITEPSSKFRNQ